MAAKVRGGANARRVMNQQRSASGVAKVHVGFFASARYPDGTPVTNVAAWNEFGTEASAERPFDVPERPFMRPVAADSRKDVRNLLRSRVDPEKMIVTRVDANILGAYIQDLIQTKIEDLQFPPNSPVTIHGCVHQRKGSSNPLLDNGFMKNSTTWQIL